MYRPSPSPVRSLLASLVFVLLLAGCGGGGDGGGGLVDPITTNPPTSLNQAAYRPGSTEYVYGLNSYPNMAIQGAPADTDYSRWAMLHDGVNYELYFMALGSNERLYRFGFDSAAVAYVYGHAGPSTFAIRDAPAAADPSSIAMLHDGADYRLYMRGVSERTKLFQFGLNTGTGEFIFGYRSIDIIETTGIPADADLDRWGMLHDGTTYRQYVGQQGNTNTLYQFGFDGRSYEYGYSSIPVLSVVDMPATSLASTFAMLHDGSDYRFYNLAR
jgi:hypothetical protein